MSQFVEGSVKSFTAGAAIAQHILVYLSSGVLQVAALGTQPIGTITEAAFASGDVRGVRLLSAKGTIPCVASGTFSQGAIVYGRALGKVDDISTTAAVRIGMALEAATTAGDIIEVMPC
jgi:hypothetical protein